PAATSPLMNTSLTRTLANQTRRLNHQPRRLNFELRAVFPTFLLHPSTPIPAGTLLGPLSGIWEARQPTGSRGVGDASVARGVDNTLNSRRGVTRMGYDGRLGCPPA